MPDFEIIFVDDASTDHSLRIIKEQALENPKIKFISFRGNPHHPYTLQCKNNHPELQLERLPYPVFA